MENVNDYIVDVFKKRYTCKGYDPEKKVSDKDFNTIMEIARLSPSSMGFEPWKFVLLRNKKVLDEIRPIAWGAQAAIDGASHIVLILSRNPKDMEPGSEYLEYIQNEIQNYPPEELAKRKERYKSFQKSDFDLNTERTLFDWISKQSYIPLANMLTVAAMLGIDSTPMEGFDREKLHEIFSKNGVYDPEHFKISTLIAFGYTNRTHREKTRRPMEEVFEVFE
ncbi:MAG: NAD(P)H-dependent oxidoreductase [Tissierellaceae bacterium]|nr:NAD(P)H-dependent oxidoreductase [Tissierellaceae bacterium]